MLSHRSKVEGKYTGGTTHLALLSMISRTSKHKRGITWEQTWWKDGKERSGFLECRGERDRPGDTGWLWELRFRQDFEK